MMTKLNLRQRVSAVLAIAVLVSGCDGENDAHEAGPAKVEAITVQVEPFELSSELPGRIEPVRVAEVRARVAGIVLRRNFEEGSDVKAGQVLFQIDPATFKAALSRALAELAKAEAAQFDALSVVKRYTPLAEIEAVSKQDFDTARTTLKSAQAARQSAQADVQTAQLDLDYATVKAPISGRIGRALVTEGALVGQNETTALATIQQLDPVYADFKQPVADVLRLHESLAAGRLTQEGPAQGLPIELTVEGTGQRREGRLLFSDITVDRGTGQVSLRGQFANPDGLLLPGMYVRVHTSQGIDPKAILVPQRAVQRSTDGNPQVLVVGQGDVVEARPVQTGVMRGSDWHITQGLKPGERVIVGNAGVVKPGAKIRVTILLSPKPASSSAPGAESF